MLVRYHESARCALQAIRDRVHAPVIATAFEITLCKSRARQSLIDENLAECAVTREYEPIGSGRLEEESTLSLPLYMARVVD